METIIKRKQYKSEVVDTTDKGIVTIAISKFDNTDSYGDVVRKGAFTKTFKEGSNRIKHVIDHKLNQMSVVGLPMKMYENDSHAIVESALNLEKQISRDLFSDYKFFKEHGKSLEHSYAYKTIKGKLLTDDKYGPEEIMELAMYEYSTVARGANEETPLLDLKSFNIDELNSYLRKYDISDEYAKKILQLIEQARKPDSTSENKSLKTLDFRLPEDVALSKYANLKL